MVRVACGMSEEPTIDPSWDQVRWRECAIRAGRMRRSWEGALGPFRVCDKFSGVPSFSPRLRQELAPRERESTCSVAA